jgi:hypothetical protein
VLRNPTGTLRSGIAKEELHRNMSPAEAKLWRSLRAQDWQNEYEYHWLIHSRGDSPEYVSIDGVLEEVTIGEEFSKDYESNLIPLCMAMNIPVKRITWFNGMPDERQIYPVSQV